MVDTLLSATSSLGFPEGFELLVVTAVAFLPAVYFV